MKKMQGLQKAMLCVFVSLLMYSCTKENAYLKANNSSVADSTSSGVSLLAAIHQYTAGYEVSDSFQYDSVHRVVAFLQSVYDSTKGSSLSSGFYTYFAYSGGSSLPYAYTQTINGFSFTDKHLLTYDGQGRIVRDTSLSGSGFVCHYAYPGDNIASTLLFDGSPGNNQIDTLFLTGGNIHSGHIYYPNTEGGADSLSAVFQFGFTAYANPGYNSTASPAIGPLLYLLTIDGYGGYSDYISKNAVSQISGSGQGLPPGTVIGISYTPDAQNRAAKAVETYAGITVATTVFTYY